MGRRDKKHKQARDEKRSGVQKPKSPQSKIVNISKVRQGPLRHTEGLTPAMEQVARWTYEHAGRFNVPTFEQWELGFMRDTHPNRELLIWEAIARGRLKYIEQHPEAAEDKGVVAAFLQATMTRVDVFDERTGKTVHAKAKRTATQAAQDKIFLPLFEEQWAKRWHPNYEIDFEFPVAEDTVPVVRFEQIIDNDDQGTPIPALGGPLDIRRLIAEAEAILGQDTVTGKQFCIYGRELLEQIEAGIATGDVKVIAISMDASSKTKQELEKILATVLVLRGRHDFFAE